MRVIYFLVAHPKLFPTVLISLDLLASAVYACNQDWRKTLYWMSAALLTICVTY